MKEETIEMIEIWSPSEKDGEAVTFPDGKKLKQVAVIVNGIPIKLDKDWVMERREISKEVADNLIIQSRPSVT